MRTKRPVTLCLALTVPCVLATASTLCARSIESQPTVWTPDPDAQTLRPFAPEPTPFTLEAGRFGIEADLFNLAWDRHNPDRTNERVRAMEWPLLFRYGVTDSFEMQIGADLYVRETVRDRDAGTRETSDGFGDITVGAKYNLWGNDGGETALALMPYLTLPTNRHGLTSRAVQGGLLIPFAMELPAEFVLEWTPGFSAVRTSDDDGYTFEWSSLVVLGRDIVDDWSWFVEFETYVTAESGDPWVGTINGGIAWEVTEDTILELGAAVGVTRSADDIAVYFTIAQRF